MDHNWHSYRDPNFHDRFFRHDTVRRRISELRHEGSVNVREIALSAEGRQIYCLSTGSGPVRVLVWSQMHGDEPTGTMAIFDLLRFLTSTERRDTERELLLKQCTFYFVPMLNPDGAERYQRRNAQGIDLNRDFLARQTPEVSALLALHAELQPHFGFNLHDQDTLWSVTGTKMPASISLLAPPVDAQLSVPPNRLLAIAIVAGLYDMLQKLIPGQIGRWSDEYEPRAVGETFQQLGTATVLIEAGGYAGDPEKQEVRKLNYLALLHAFHLIATDLPGGDLTSQYLSIPLNNKHLFHLLVRGCCIETSAGMICADVGLNHTEVVDELGRRVKVYQVEDLGDLSTWNAYEIIDAEGGVPGGQLRPGDLANFSVETGKGGVLSFENGHRKMSV
ncbi:M14 family zinc carboxypeptidase [Arcticibacter sp. MXS-1]|uniref:M14 family zinc carboxypeptidase n=1 Tax=Arcticibacter sp. MXS-1 TaxID=3341726 RepID=UPI0035A8F206